MVQSVEDVVARWEARPIELVDTKADVDALIAAWRKLNEATRACEAIMQETLAKIRAYADDHDDEMVPILIDEALAAIRARIKL